MSVKNYKGTSPRYTSGVTHEKIPCSENGDKPNEINLDIQNGKWCNWKAKKRKRFGSCDTGVITGERQTGNPQLSCLLIHEFYCYCTCLKKLYESIYHAWNYCSHTPVTQNSRVMMSHVPTGCLRQGFPYKPVSCAPSLWNIVPFRTFFCVSTMVSIPKPHPFTIAQCNDVEGM